MESKITKVRILKRNGFAAKYEEYENGASVVTFSKPIESIEENQVFMDLMDMKDE